MSLILKVRDFGSMVPRDFGKSLREELLADCITLGALDTAKRAIDEAQRQATFVITDPTLDSYKEIIDVGAFDASLAQYMRNPVFLPEHQHVIYGSPYPAAVGVCRALPKRRKALLGVFEFDGPENPVADTRWGLYVRGIWRAVSVGFRPVRTIRDTDGVLHYTEALLKETSTVPVGANDNALLLNMYVGGRLAGAARSEADGGRVRELAAAVEELRAKVESATRTTASVKGKPESLRQRIDGVRNETAALAPR